MRACTPKLANASLPLRAAAPCTRPRSRRCAPLRCAADDGLPPPPDIAKLAAMARLEVSPEEAAEWAPRISAVVEWFGELRKVDVSVADGPGVRAGEAGASEAELAGRLRQDVVVDFPHREELLAAASTLESPFIRIPKIME